MASDWAALQRVGLKMCHYTEASSSNIEHVLSIGYTEPLLYHRWDSTPNSYWIINIRFVLKYWPDIAFICCASIRFHLQLFIESNIQNLARNIQNFANAFFNVRDETLNYAISIIFARNLYSLMLKSILSKAFDKLRWITSTMIPSSKSNKLDEV